MKRLAIIASHPVQYNAPWFQLLSQRGNLQVHVFYTWSQSEEGAKFDPDFNRVVEWDVPLLDGYTYQFVKNISKSPGSHHYRGIENPTLIGEIESWGPDAILIIGWSYKSHLACMRHFKGKLPVLFRGDSILLGEAGGIKKLLRRLFLRWVYWHIDLALYVGQNNKKYYQAHGVSEQKLMLAPHAVDNHRFEQLTAEGREAVKKWKTILGLSDDHFVVLYAGKFEPRKNPFYILELAKALPDPDVAFVLVGNGPLEDALKRESVNDNRIKFLPFQNQSIMPAVYRLGDVFLLPSRSETWGLAANEAMAAGLPLLLSNQTGGGIDLVDGNGILFDPSDVDAPAAYLRGLKNSEREMQKTKENSTSHIKKFTFVRIAEAVEKACSL